MGVDFIVYLVKFSLAIAAVAVGLKLALIAGNMLVERYLPR